MSKFSVIALVSILFGLISSLFVPLVAFAEETAESTLQSESDLDDELKYLQEETYVITPSRIPQRIEKAPGSIYVVTDKQIRQMGARYLNEVIETVPGWYNFADTYGTITPFARGSAGVGGDQILLMINSQMVNNAYDGSPSWYYQLDLDNVKRIEVVSGPGSSLYGSGAMAGIINVITKEGEDVDGLQLTGRGGSYDTWEGNALFGKKIEGFEIAGYADYVGTDGFQGHVNRDRQSVLDQMYGTHASIAPGNMQGNAYQLDGQLTMKYKGLKFDGKYLGRKIDGPFGGTAILDDMTNKKAEQYYLNLSYDATLMEGFDLTAKIYRNQSSTSDTIQWISKGAWASTPTGPMLMSKNMFWETSGKNRRTGAEAQSTYRINDVNTLVGGITFERMEVYDSKGKANFMGTDYWGVIIPLPSVQDFPESLMVPDSKRDIWAVYVEDLWDIIDDLRLTVGGRYDHYSDVGGQFSPRVGINWDLAQNYYTKFQYGRSFRAPTFNELYLPFRGNPDLEPITRDSYELSFGARFLPVFSAEVTCLYSKAKNNIIGVLEGNPPQFMMQNAGKAQKKGIELQMKYDFGRGTFLSMNYTYLNLDVEDGDGQPIVVWWMEPKQLGTLSANIRLNRYLNLNTYLLYRGDWARKEGDTRDDPGDYAIVNATLITRNFLKELEGLEVRASVKNLLNKDYTSPTGPGELPDDMPMPGINFFLEMRYTF